MTVRWLSKSWGGGHALKGGNSNNAQPAASKLIVCTGERMGALVNKLYLPQGIQTTTFEPVHEKGLSNEFYCYSNFECEDWKRRI